MKSLKCFVERSTAVLLLCAAGTGAAHADFSGYYTLDNWTLENTPVGANGFVDPSTGDATTIMLMSSSNGIGGFTDFFITIPVDGTVSFDWFFDIPVTEIGFEYAGGLLLNGTRTPLAVAPSMGFLAVPVSADDVFGFYVESFDGLFEPGIFTITNFSAPVPVPAALWLFGSALLGLGVVRRRFSTRS